MRLCSRLIVFLFACLTVVSDGSGADPLSPEEAVDSFELREGYKLSLVAAEPDVIDPVSVTFDAEGRMWVVEMHDYPNGPADGKSGQCRIKILTDPDQDGRYELTSVFTEELLFATGLLPWKEGAIVTLAGEVEYFADTDGDGRADKRETWLTGFAEQNPQLRANHPTLGPDGWIYIANGLRGGAVTVAHPDWPKVAEPIQLRGKDFRFHPVTGECEAIAGNGQFGMSFDAWGNRMICSNRNPCMQVMLNYDQLTRQPRLAIGRLVHDVSPAGVDSRLYALTDTWTTSNLHQGQFTAACGVLALQEPGLADPALNENDPGLRDAYIYACDPTANLVHRDWLAYDGSTFQAVKPHQKEEFFASRDEWFRPVNLTAGPDRALYVADMYRAVIEHPQFMPDELKERPDLTLGNDRGRIWKIEAVDPDKDSNLAYPLAETNDETLLQWLGSDNVFLSQLAFHELVEQQRKDVLPELREWASESATVPRFLAVLRLSDSFGSLRLSQLEAGLSHDDPRIVVTALKLLDHVSSEKREGEEWSRLRGKLIRHLSDSRGPVRYAAMLALQNFADGQAIPTGPVVQAMLHGQADDWIRHAALLLLETEQLPRTIPLVTDSEADAGSQLAALREIAELLGRNQQQPLTRKVLTALLESKQDYTIPQLTTIITSLGQGLQSRGVSLADEWESLVTAESIEQEKRKEYAKSYQALAETLLAEIEKQKELGPQLAAIGALEYVSRPSVQEKLYELTLDDSAPVNLRTSALNALASSAHDVTKQQSQELISLIRSETPAMRRELVEFCLRSSERSLILLDRIQDGELKFTELASDQKTRLARSGNQDVRAAYAKLQEAQTSTDRQEVLKKYQAVLANAKLDRPAAERGHELFKEHCTICHKIGDDGIRVGPDISDTRTKQPGELLTNILDPNRAIDNNYFSYTAVTIQGKVVTGILAEETPYSITLKQAKGKPITLQREEIEEFASDGVSFMPQQFEKNITPEQMVDLISYLKNWRYLEQDVPFVEKASE